MQDAQVAWDNASQETRDAIQSAVILNGEGKVVYIGPTKENPPLENWVRSFANGKTYIGIGAWGDFKGDVNDNNQVSWLSSCPQNAAHHVPTPLTSGAPTELCCSREPGHRDHIQ